MDCSLSLGAGGEDRDGALRGCRPGADGAAKRSGSTSRRLHVRCSLTAPGQAFLTASVGEPKRPFWLPASLEDVPVTCGCSSLAPEVWSGCHHNQGTRQWPFVLELVAGCGVPRAALVQGEQGLPDG